MSDRRPENPKPVKLNEVEELWVTTNYSMRPPTPADLIAVVRRGVESGTIKGEVMKLCRSHEGGVKTIGLTDERCHRRFGSVIPCEFDEGLVIPVSDGGSET